MNNITIYQILDSLESAFELMESAQTDAEFEAASKAFEDLKISLDERLENFCGYIKNTRITIEAVKSEAKRLNDLAHSLERRADNALRYLSGIIPAGQKWQRGSHSIGWRKSEAVIVNEEILPDDYKRTKIVIEPDKIKIKEAIKEGIDVIGALLELRNNIQVR